MQLTRRSGLQAGRPAAPARRLAPARPARRVAAAVKAEYIGKGDSPAATPSPAKPAKEEGPVAAVPVAAPASGNGNGAAAAAPAKQADALAGLTELRALIDTAVQAQHVYSEFTQEQVDAIFKAAAAAASAARIELAVMAVDDTGMGLMEDKVRR